MSNTLRKQLLPFQPAAGRAARRRCRPAIRRAERLASRRAWRPSPQMLAAGLPLSCVSVSTDRCSTPTRTRRRRSPPALGEVAQTLYAFQRDLEARGLDDRVLTLVWSEFGRRPQENASAGTDHGAAGCAFVIGTHAAGTMIGEWHGLSERP